jgi:hypothetical protein
MIVSFNFYYALPGQEDAVLRQRLRASDVRQNIGIPRGRVLSRTAGDADLPDVIWEHHFDDVAGHHADMAARAASVEFESIRAGMRKLYRRFERPLFEISGTAAPNFKAPARVVSLEWVFCAPASTAETLVILDQQATLYAQQGLDRGRLLRLITPGSDLPELIWQHECVDATNYDLMRAEIPAAVKALAQRVERSFWKVE